MPGRSLAGRGVPKQELGNEREKEKKIVAQASGL
jgi:hypothetical protein